MAYSNNHFCWFEINSTDKDAAAAFYPEVTGWRTQEVDMGPAGMYTMFLGSDVARGGFSDTQGGAPSHWNSYLKVDDVDARTAAARANGGSVVAEPMDVPGVGRMSVVRSPSGAICSLFHEADPATSHDAPQSSGAIHWTELQSRDVDADLAWLRASFGFQVGTMPMPDGGTYHLLETGPDSMAGGVCPPFLDGAPSMWMNWVWVDDVDATVARAASNGGTVHSPAMDMPGIGRMAVLADPTGAVFGVMTPSG